MSRYAGRTFRLKVWRRDPKTMRGRWWYLAETYENGGERYSARAREAMIVDHERMESWRLANLAAQQIEIDVL